MLPFSLIILIYSGEHASNVEFGKKKGNMSEKKKTPKYRSWP